MPEKTYYDIFILFRSFYFFFSPGSAFLCCKTNEIRIDLHFALFFTLCVSAAARYKICLRVRSKEIKNPKLHFVYCLPAERRVLFIGFNFKPSLCMGSLIRPLALYFVVLFSLCQCSRSLRLHPFQFFVCQCFTGFHCVLVFIWHFRISSALFGGEEATVS